MKFLIVFLLCVTTSTVFAQKKSERDSVKVIIDSIFPGGIHGTFRSGCTTLTSGTTRQDLYYMNGNIAFVTNKSDVIKIKADTATIRWRDPKYKGGRYFLVFKNIFDEIVDYRIATKNSYFIDFNKMDPHCNILTVYSEDGRASSIIFLDTKK